MTLLLTLAFVAAVGSLASAFLGTTLAAAWRWRRGSEATHPWAGAAPSLALAVPALGLVVAATALLPAKPWLWLEGLCACEAIEGHHVCPFHMGGATVLVGAAGVAAATMVGARLPAVLKIVRRVRELGDLLAAGIPGPDGIVHFDGGGRPLVFVAGVQRPRLFAEAAWWSSLTQRDRAVVLAHERSHRDARDPATMLVLDLVLVLFAPRARAEIVSDWALATELRADAAAAAEDGDPLYVAEVLCRYARAGAPAGAVALGGRGLETRVLSLLADPGPPRRQWRAATPLVSLGAVCLATAIGHVSHRLFDALLGALV